ncbi:hypothetical protein [Halorientalis regularis]|uniref:Uncharacterized protein n=1 Tax=Halorientalis regularis TaxID=660518 RepID=A0A1G7TC98_9EURY|nr:hypothetical protein [Halorientalis regularis]SDG32664.1 hypothetical protein SAMN05216218_12433 [Halorientalis regularis]
MSTEDATEETPSQNATVIAKAPVNILVDEDESLEEALSKETGERFSEERMQSFFEDASFVVAPVDDDQTAAHAGQEIDPLGYYVVSNGTAYGPYNAEDRAYRRAARWSESEDAEFTVERGAVLADNCTTNSLPVKTPTREELRDGQ